MQHGTVDNQGIIVLQGSRIFFACACLLYCCRVRGDSMVLYAVTQWQASELLSHAHCAHECHELTVRELRGVETHGTCE